MGSFEGREIGWGANFSSFHYWTPHSFVCVCASVCVCYMWEGRQVHIQYYRWCGLIRAVFLLFKKKKGETLHTKCSPVLGVSPLPSVHKTLILSSVFSCLHRMSLTYLSPYRFNRSALQNNKNWSSPVKCHVYVYILINIYNMQPPDKVFSLQNPSPLSLSCLALFDLYGHRFLIIFILNLLY